MTQLDKCVYTLGEEYLSKLKRLPISQLRVNYLTTPPRKTSLPEIYRTLLGVATGGNLNPGVFSGLIGGIDPLREILFHFDPFKVANKYQGNAQIILDEIIDRFHLRNMRTKKHWHKKKDGSPVQVGGDLVGHQGGMLDRLSKIIADGAILLGAYQSADDFYAYLDVKREDFKRKYTHLPAKKAGIESKLDLAKYLHKEVYNFGLALALNFLMAISYADFIKPDVHVTGVFSAFRLSASPDTKEVFRSAHRVADNSGTTVFAIDKVFWHIGEYAKGQRDQFIKWARTEIEAGRC